MKSIQSIRVFEAFAGIGAQHEGFDRLQADFPEDIEFEYVGMSEIDEQAEISYKAAHGEVCNYGDITKIDWNDVPDFDMFTWSFPCQDISNAGKQKGRSKESGSRSSLAWECVKALSIKRPKWALMENVKALTQKKFAEDFAQLRKEIEDLGYRNFYAVLNAKDYGEAQNRERVFMVSIRKDFEEPYYNFPFPFPLEKCVEDYMEPAEDIDESYFIDQERITNKVLFDIIEQPNVYAEIEDLYHAEWACRRLYGKVLKYKEIMERIDEINAEIERFRNETDSL